MPELPEVETTRRGIAPHILGTRIERVIVRQRSLRWNVPPQLGREVRGRVVRSVDRRAKYLLINTEPGTVLVHLGMSGSLRIVPTDEPLRPHDHVDFVLQGNRCLRFHDPRRFGAVLWTRAAPERHRLLQHLGPEPLGPGFDGDYLFDQSRGRNASIKTFIMDAKVVVGVGNIYANEALFLAGIRPARAAGRVSRQRCRLLAEQIRFVLSRAIEAGGTTLRDFLGSDGQPGYFKQSLAVYDRTGQPCLRCEAPICHQRLGQRSTFSCPRCQT